MTETPCYALQIPYVHFEAEWQTDSLHDTEREAHEALERFRATLVPRMRRITPVRIMMLSRADLDGGDEESGVVVFEDGVSMSEYDRGLETEEYTLDTVDDCDG